MTYLVMECGTSYAVVLDAEGRYLRVANRGYEVGQTVTDVIPADEGRTLSLRTVRILRLIFSTIFTFIVLALIYHFFLFPYGTVRMQINPDVLISVNRVGYVLHVTGLNEEGRQLAGECRTAFCTVEQVTTTLVGRAMESGFLTDGGSVSLRADCEDADWVTETEILLRTALSVRFHDSGLEVGTIAAEGDNPAEPTTAPDDEGPTELPLTMEEALEAARAHFGIAYDAQVHSEKIEEENGIWEIEFSVGHTEYECEIRASDGEVIKAEKEKK